MTEPFAGTVVIVDDEQDILLGYSILLRRAGFERVLSFQDSRLVMDALREQSAAVVVLDLNMPFLSGFDLLQEIGRELPRVRVLVVTAANELEMAVQCMKAGAVDYFVKPVERTRLLASVRRAAETLVLEEQIDSLRKHLIDERLEQEEAFTPIVTCSPRMRGIFRYLEAVAATGQPVLIQGETGVGKELFARAIHEASRRPGRFVAVNVAGLDDHMFSDTLFGHARGAFTGADSRREGLIVQAAGGTLFLDEIGDLSEASQLRLLRLLQEGEYYPLGADHPQRSQARVVVATNRDLNGASGHRFRTDLYYRLCVHRADIPSLRERPEDLPLLLCRFIQEAAETLGKKPPTLPPELVHHLRVYPFPGNVRELKAMTFDAVARHERGVLSMDSFLEKLGASRSAPRPASAAQPLALTDPLCIPTLKEAEEFLVAKALDMAQGNQGAAATLLGITRQGLNKKLNRKK